MSATESVSGRYLCTLCKYKLKKFANEMSTYLPPLFATPPTQTGELKDGHSSVPLLILSLAERIYDQDLSDSELTELSSQAKPRIALISVSEPSSYERQR